MPLKVEPTYCTVRYTQASEGGGLSYELRREITPGTFEAYGEATLCATLEISVDEVADVDPPLYSSVYSFTITPKCDIEIQRFVIECPTDFSQWDSLLCNGYQSATQTAERSPRDRLKGLELIPPGMVERRVLDAAGDYRFVDYPCEVGSQHGWTYLYLRDTSQNSDECLLIASLDESHGFTLLRSSFSRGLITIYPELPGSILEANTTWQAAIVCINATLCLNGGEARYHGSVDPVLSAVFDRWFALMDVQPLPANPLTGYVAWHERPEDVCENMLKDELLFATRGFSILDTCGFTKAFVIDKGYAPMGDWLTPSKKKFPSGMDSLAEQIKAADFLPGIWFAPFVCERASALFANHPDWLLRDEEGDLVSITAEASGAFALDTLNPAVREYVTYILSTLTDDWGFELIVLDYLFAACVHTHGGKNRGELMDDAISLLRSAAPSALFLGCKIPLASAFGTLQYCRISCDITTDFDGPAPLRMLESERKSTKNCIGNIVYRAPLNGRAFLADPNRVLLCDDVRMTRPQKDYWLTSAACFSGALMTSDDLCSLSVAQRKAYQDALFMMRTALAQRNLNV